MAAAARALGWPEQIVDVTRAQLQSITKMQIQLMDQMMDAWEPTRRGLNPAATWSRFRALGSSRGLNRAAWGCAYFRECEVVHTSLLIPPSRVQHSEFGRCHEGERWHSNQIASHLGSRWFLRWR
jgi:hypothetical protein